MGIDIYARWRNQSPAERDAQFTGFSDQHGHVGYLREAYHGEPYVTQFMVSEAFEQDAAIPAKTLRARLPRAIALCKQRYRKLYRLSAKSDETRAACQSYQDFVALCEQKEAETGEPVVIHASW